TARACRWAAAAGALSFLGVWVKLNFVWLLPAVLSFGAVSARPSPRRSALAAGLGVFLATFLLPTAWLLLARTSTGEPYYDVLRLGEVSAEPDEIAAHAGTLATYVVDGAAVVPRVLALPRTAADIGPCLLAALLLAWGAWRGPRAKILLWLLCALLTFGL